MLKRFSSGFAFLALFFICLASFSLMFWASRTDSAIDDELAHIPAGYGYVHNLDYRLNPEHPPLIKALAMLPVLFINPAFPTTSAAWQTEINGQWDMGAQFLYQAGNDANEIIQTGRVMPMLITLLVIILIYFLARDLMGDWWALLPSFLFALSPTILAHGHYVTTDVGAAFGVMLSFYFFIRYLEFPSTKNFWLAGITFGIAQLTKFSTPLLIPLYIFMVVVLWARDTALDWDHTAHKFKKFTLSLLKRGWKLILIGLIGYIVIVYPTYFLFTAHYPIAKQVSDTTQILTSFATGPTPAGHLCSGIRCLADLDIWMAGNHVFRPFGQYLLGLLMVLQRSDGGNTIYFLGQVRGTGGWIYFPVLYLLKEPIPTLIIVFTALILALWWMVKRAIASRGRIKQHVLDYLGVNFAEFSMASFVIFYWGYSMRSPLNIGIRHIIPTLPFIYILSAGVWKKWVMRLNIPGSGEMTLASMMSGVTAMAKSLLASSIKYVILILLLLWLLLESLFAAPYFLSYFNEFGGGVYGGYHYVTDSNYDWGQDLLRLQTFVNQHPEIDKIAVDYFGGGSPSYYLGKKEVDWNSAKGNPAAQGIHWIAISINQLQGAIEPLAPGQTRNLIDSYPWLTALRPPAPGMGNVPPPDFRVGTSIFVYHL